MSTNTSTSPDTASAGPLAAWLAEALAVFVKEWRCELRTRYALNTLALFAVTTLVVVSVGLGPIGASSSEKGAVLPVVLWIILLFAVTAGLPRAFVVEEETHTATALRMSATPSALFWGKLLYSLTLVLVLEVLVTPLFLAMMDLDVARPGQLLLALAGGGFGLAAGGTLIAAIIAQARGRGTLFAVLALPILLPLLVIVIQISRAAVTGEVGTLDEAATTAAAVGDPAIRLLLLYDATVTVAGSMLFPTIWNP